jgi:anti-sigma factor ChrR (cupin superfamily)
MAPSKVWRAGLSTTRHLLHRMKLHADLALRAVVHAGTLDWTPSPEPGVERKMLERDGAEVARATSLVRFAAGARFSSHRHDLGEEMLVLAGVFSDDDGDFGAGIYLRNPPGSAHAPWSEQGCLLFVKLRQMEPKERRRVAIDPRALRWGELQPGVWVLELHSGAHERVELVRLDAGASITLEDAGGEEALLLDGSAQDGLGVYARYSWFRNPPGTATELGSRGGCVFYRKRGHLAR